MFTFKNFILLLHLLSLTASQNQSCKPIPGSSTWPTETQWTNLNTSVSGNLIIPTPPGSVCHPSQPDYNTSACSIVQEGWNTTLWHTETPVSTIQNNWANDTCLPSAIYPCSPTGYPRYVINATTIGDVKIGVDFARETGVRLVVRGTGHDYLGRSNAPNSLSIWTHKMLGISFHEGFFQPTGCQYSIDTQAITVAAGEQMLNVNYEAHLRNLTIVSGASGTVGIGGYLTGGGHSAYSSTYGLAADQVLEMEIVTAAGEILMVNECQNTDLFWALRGGGGSTFGIITSATIKAYASTEFVVSTVLIGTSPSSSSSSSEAYWEVTSQILSQFPNLSNQGISAYTNIAPNYTNADLGITSPLDSFYGYFMLPLLSPSTNTSSSLELALNTVLNNSIKGYEEDQFFTFVNATTYPDYWAFYSENNFPDLDAGIDLVLGSRLLDEKALTGNLTGNLTLLKETCEVIAPGTPNVYLVGGRGVRDVVPRGGSDAVNEAWRSAYVHLIVGVGWIPFDDAEKSIQEDLLTNTYVEALRRLAPDTGSYLNEADPNEPNFQQAFWGNHYARLLEIKKTVDPDDVFWCYPCVGSEGWEVVGDVLCRK